MRFARSGLPNYPVDSSIYPVKGMDDTKVYPFTASFPRYASWKEYVRTLLNQLKSCPNCRAAANEFPISLLPKVHKLSNGKTLIFKGRTSTSEQLRNSADDCHSEIAFTPQANSLIEPIPTSHHQLRQSLSTVHEVVEEYDMVSLDPNCPRHGKYSRSAWLRKQRTKLAEVKVGPRQQIISKANESKGRSRGDIDKREPKTYGPGRSISSDFWKPLDKFYLHMLDKDVVEMPLRVAVSAFKRRKGENFEPNELKQVAAPGSHMTSVLSQKQHNILSMHNQKKDFVAGTKPYRTKSADCKQAMAKLSREEQCVCEDGYFESNARQMNVKNTSMEMGVTFGIPLPALVFGQGLPISDLVNKVESEPSTGRCLEMAEIDELRSTDLAGDVATEATKFSEEKNSTHATSAMEMTTSIREKFVSTVTRYTAPVEAYNQNRQKREPSQEFVKDVHKWRETYASQYTRMCRLKGLNRDVFGTCDAVVESKDNQNNKLLLERHQVHVSVSELDMNVDFKASLPAREFIQQGNDHTTNETAIELVGDELRASTPTRFTIERQQVASDVFNLEELELTRQRLEKIAATAKALQLGLKENPLREETLITNVHRTQAQAIVDRNEARDWLPNMAIERATNKLPKISCDSGRVRRLVQAIERIK